MWVENKGLIFFLRILPQGKIRRRIEGKTFFYLRWTSTRSCFKEGILLLETDFIYENHKRK